MAGGRQLPAGSGDRAQGDALGRKNDRFRIHKTGAPVFPWAMDYPAGFSDGPTGVACGSFETAVAEFIDAANRQCPTCRRGAVVDTDWGWKCEACGECDVAVGCEAPITGHDFLPVRGHPDDDECTYRSDGTNATYCGETRDRHER